MGQASQTIFFGSGSFALPTLRRLAAEPIVAIVAVLTAPARPQGRHGEVEATPVGLEAARLGLPVLTPSSLRDEETLATLADLEPDLIVLADYGRIIPGAVLRMPTHGALNLHPSLLPRHRGAAPVPAAILAGDAVTGVTLMHMDEGLDTGPIVAQRTVELRGDEDAPGLEAKLADEAADLLAASLPAWLSGGLRERPQPTEGATLTRPLRRADGLLDARRPAPDLERRVRALRPWPGTFIEVEGQRLIVWSAAAVPDAGADPETATIGSLSTLDDGIALVTSSGLLRLDEVQPAGKRRMSGAEYARGRRSRP